MTYLAAKQANRGILHSNNCNLSVRPKRAHVKERLSPFVLSTSSSSIVRENRLVIKLCMYLFVASVECCATKSESLKRDLYSKAQ